MGNYRILTSEEDQVLRSLCSGDADVQNSDDSRVNGNLLMAAREIGALSEIGAECNQEL